MSRDGLLIAKVLDGKGGARDVDWGEVNSWRPEDGVLWLHFDRTVPAVAEWLTGSSGLDRSSCASLLEANPRPRSLIVGDGLLIILRGVNANAGSEPADMVSLRMWIEAARVITLRQRPVAAAREIASDLERGVGPAGSGALVVRVAEALTDRISAVVDDLEDEVDDLEEGALEEDRVELRSDVAAVRRRALGLRRYLASQRDVLGRAQLEDITWLPQDHSRRLSEVAHHVVRLVENIDAQRERAAIVQDTLNGRASEQMNRNLYGMSIVAAVFLPLSLVTGLLGINVGGMPGVGSDEAFWVVCGLLGVTAIGELCLLRKLRWL